MLSWQRVQWGHLFCRPPYSVATCSVTGSLDISRATPTFVFFSKIRSVSPEPFPKNKHKTFGLHKPQWWHQRVIVPKWNDEHSKTTGIYYLLFTHHNGTILEQLSERVNERKGTKNQQNKFTALSQQANLSYNSRQNETSVIVYSTSYLSKCIYQWVFCWIQSRTFEKYLTLNVWSRLLLFSCFYLFYSFTFLFLLYLYLYTYISYLKE